MARDPKLTQVVVYLSNEERDRLRDAAKLERRSLTKYLLHLGLVRAAQLERSSTAPAPPTAEIEKPARRKGRGR